MREKLGCEERIEVLVTRNKKSPENADPPLKIFKYNISCNATYSIIFQLNADFAKSFCSYLQEN